MGLLGLILAAVLVAVLIAIVIVKYLPLKLRWIASVLLLLLSVFLVFKIYNGVMEPINFGKAKVKKYAPVIKNLKIIRDAQVKYYESTGTYTKDKSVLIKFIDSAQLALTNTKTIVVKENKGGGIIVDVEKRVTDTIGYEPVLKYFKDRDYKNMFKVPGVAGKEFEVEVASVEKVPGLVVPTFMIKTPKKALLEGMNESLTKIELEASATDQVKGEYISVGSLDEVTTGGNWPPSYDKNSGKKTSNTSLTTIKENKLSIQFNLDGFSFSIYNTTSKKDVYFCEYTFNKTQLTPEDLLLKIKEIFKTDTNLQHDFSSVTVIHQNNLSTLVPNSFFNENELASYLNFNIKTLATDFITFDEIEILESKNIYVPYVNINNYLFQNFGEFEYKHHSTVLIEKLLKRNKITTKTMYVNVSKTNLDIVVLENGKLILSNTFSYNSKEDFIYYILFVAEQLNLDTTEFPLYFMGEIKVSTDIYKITYQYIKNVYFLESKNTIFNKLNSPSHSNFILLGS